MTSSPSTSPHLADEAYDLLRVFLSAAGNVLGADSKLALIRDVDALLREGHTADELTALVQRFAHLRCGQSSRRPETLALCTCDKHSFRAFVQGGGAEPSTGRVVRAWWAVER